MCTRSLDVDPRLRPLQDVKTIFQNFYIINYLEKPEDCYIYQHLNDSEVEGKSFASELPKFCFPYGKGGKGGTYSTPVIDDSGTFTLALTDDKGQRQFGYCRYVKEPGTSITLCFCVLSYLPQVEFFDQVLDVLLDMWDDSLDMVQIFMTELLAQKVPESGGSVRCTPRGQTCRLLFPNTRLLPSMPHNLNLTTFFNKVKIDMMLSLFTSLLLERRIILTSDRLSVLTASANALNTLLYPLSWQHIFIPVLPEQLLDYVTAPMPFLVGVHKSLMPRVLKLDLEEVVFCDLDEQIVRTWTNDVALLPPELVAVLEANIKKPQTSMDDNFARIFLDLFLYLFGSYRDFITISKSAAAAHAASSAVAGGDGGSSPVPNNARITSSPVASGSPNTRPVLEMNREAFLASKPEGLQPFLTQLLDLQMFHQFIDGRVELMCVPSKGSTRRMTRFVKDSISGKLILPRWWVYDCLFEYEFDECGNRGTDLNAERMAVYKSKMMVTMRKSKARLGPSFSAFSSNVKTSVNNARRRIEESQISSENTSPLTQRDSRGSTDSRNGAFRLMSRPSTEGSLPPPRPLTEAPPSRHSPNIDAKFARSPVSQRHSSDIHQPMRNGSTSSQRSRTESQTRVPGDALIDLLPTHRGAGQTSHASSDARTQMPTIDLLGLDKSNVQPQHTEAVKDIFGAASGPGAFDPFSAWTGASDSAPSNVTSHSNQSNVLDSSAYTSSGPNNGMLQSDVDLLGLGEAGSQVTGINRPVLPPRTSGYQRPSSASSSATPSRSNSGTHYPRPVQPANASSQHTYPYGQGHSHGHGLTSGNEMTVQRTRSGGPSDGALLHSVKGLQIGSEKNLHRDSSSRGPPPLPPPSLPAHAHASVVPHIPPKPPTARQQRRPSKGANNEFDPFQ
ncbi:hypothetical protein SARC_05887 [Sphaeroforma arctica JP610]|uniref:UDENN domain-containing protein n=1 Tax=Sphaeroforma arctica JP610 TaxID=667725 RepID=A0A0L0FY96_9EUKA|nr:hypothetical protein SARC_05887 [Sphaeroforma arctica JP610]KNC81802.1 hypothetical protein SARC_05887 [Sphaeroforma arctica JP610]|eukprot:XP_014155704.1 hypothetical protein SARC_05887 [Sphaeroforma arctica JP610]